MGSYGLQFTNWVLWATLAAGTLLVVGITELMGGTTRGYRLFMAWLIAVLAGVLVASEFALPVVSAQLDPPASPLAVLRRPLVLAFGVGALAYLVSSVARWPRTWIAIGSGLVGFVALLALAAGEETHSPPLFAAQLAVGALALGSVNAAMLLGHWYLVTPRLSPAPLRRMIWLLIASLALQGVLFGLAIGFVGTQALAEPIGWLTWLRLGVGVGLALVTAVLALAASRSPSLQASTGLLYIGLAFVMAGSIAGASISYLTGVPV